MGTKGTLGHNKGHRDIRGTYKRHRRDIGVHRRTWGNKGVNIRGKHGNIGGHRVDMGNMG